MSDRIEEIVLRIVSSNLIVNSISIFILVTSMTLEANGYHTAFERCGAIFVLLALLCVWFNGKYQRTLTRLATTQQVLPIFGLVADIKTSIDGDVTIKETSRKHDEALENIVKQAALAKLALKNLQETEIVFGFFGTAIWAFGDLFYLPKGLECCVGQ